MNNSNIVKGIKQDVKRTRDYQRMCNDWKVICEEQKTLIESLQQENERLKKQLQSWRDACDCGVE